LKNSVLVPGLILIAALGLGAWYALLRPVERPNVLLITIDTLRADHLGTYGYERATSPTIDSLAASGVAFDNAFAQAILSGPSHATIFTSLHTPVHGVINNGVVMDPDNLTFTELLRASGYTTAMFVSHDLMSAEFGFGQGFEVSENHPVEVHRHGHDDDEAGPGAMLPLESVFDAVIAWLDRPRDKPFFVWMHVQHAHMSWEPPPPFDTMFGEPPQPERYDLRCRDTLYAHRAEEIVLSEAEQAHVAALYDGEIAYVDDQLARVLSAVRAQDRETLVALTADHGELLFDGATRRLVGHGHRSSEPILHVPLILNGPGVPRGPRRVEAMVGLIDLGPTLLDLAGIIAPKSFQGTSLEPLMHGRSDGIRSQNFSGTIHFDGHRPQARGLPAGRRGHVQRRRTVTATSGLAVLVALDLVVILINALGLAPSFLNLDEEQNLTTWYSSAKLLGSALAAIWCMRLERPADLAGPRRWVWPAIALLFVGLSMDETATAHERLAAWFMSGTGGDALRTRLLGGDASKDAFAWPVLFAPVIAGIVILLVVALYRLMQQNRRSFFLGLAGCTAFVTAVLLEGPAVYGSPPIEAWGDAEVARYMLFVLVEESAEVLGTTLMLASLVLHARFLSEHRS